MSDQPQEHAASDPLDVLRRPPVAPTDWPGRLRDASAALGVPLPVVAGAGLALVALAIVLVLLWPRSSPAPAAPITLEPLPAEPSAPATTTTTDVYVHAAGAVVRPGVYRLPPTARVADVIEAAGGLSADADADRLNLAATLQDGARVYVPRLGESEPPAIAPDGGGAAGAPSATPTGDSLVDLNRASAAELEELPGVGPATADAIVAHRQANGPFTSVDELLDVRGIGPAKLEQLRPLVKV